MAHFHPTITFVFAGAFGKVDPGGGSVLSDYLKQLEAQQELVREMIANQRVLLKSGKVEAAGKLRPAVGKMVRAGTMACPDCSQEAHDNTAIVPACRDGNG